MESNDLIKEIERKTNLNFFRLREVFYSTTTNTCEISLIYPSTNNITEEERKNVKEVVVNFLALKNAKVIVKINKSFVESELIKKEVLNFISVGFPILYNSIQEDKIAIYVDTPSSVRIRFSLEEGLYKLFNSFNASHEISAHLEKNFCASFEVSAVCFDKVSASESYLNERIEILKEKSNLDAIIGFSKDKYMVKDVKTLVGNEIKFQPKHISSVKEPCDDCVVAGKISFLTERTYTSKRKKKNKDGTEEAVIKPYFNFTLKDNSASINAVIFPSKEKYHKMNLLADGNEVLVRGRVSKYNDKFEIFVKDISLCTLPNKYEVATNVVESEITDYKYITPVKYNSFKQSNLFEGVKTLSREIQNGSFVVYDFETTGLDPVKDEIIEIGALKIVNGEYKEIFTTLVNPKRPIPAQSTKVNRITDDMVANAYTIEQVICDFFLFCKNCQMVGYNSLAFDSLFLNNAGKKVGLNFSNTQIDCFLLAKEKLHGLKNYKLGTVSKFLDVNLIDAHRALNDVIATAECFLKLY